tara:strand:+ start:6973 stop:7920 length:948 start_codon:yes stop_codon:yes gene_type:complete
MINYLNLYKIFFYLRFVEQTISNKYSEGKMRCPVHLSIGQEAISAIFSCLVKKNDFTISMHRPHTHYLAKGGNLNKMISELYGKETGCSNGRGGSMHLIDENVNFMGSTSILGNNIPIGVGLALSAKTLNKKNITFIFLGDAAVEQGSFYESMNFAAINNLKIIFICENNELSVYTDLISRQPKNRKIFELVKSIGVQSSFSKGKNLQDIHNKMKKAIDYVNKNKKPFFLEVKTTRWLEHCGPNDDSNLGYRSSKELQIWKKNDFLIQIQSKLKKDSNKINKIENEIKSKVFKAFEFAEKSKFPNHKDLLIGVYE